MRKTLFNLAAAAAMVAGPASLSQAAGPANELADPACREDPDGSAVCEAPNGPSAAPTNSSPVTKQIWARSYLWADAPDIEVARWLTEEPAMQGKFILIEFWRTWCGACKRTTPLLNELHRKFREDLVVIGITGETEEEVKAYAGPAKNYSLALDKPRPGPAKDRRQTATGPANEHEAGDAAGPDRKPDHEADGGQGAYEARFDVWGWPHVILLEPNYRAVVWEGFPGLKDAELTVEMVGRYIELGKEDRTAGTGTTERAGRRPPGQEPPAE